MERLHGIIDTWVNEGKVLPDDVEWMIKKIKQLEKEKEWLTNKCTRLDRS